MSPLGCSRNSERKSWGFLGGFAEKRAPEAAARSRAVPDQSLRLKDATEPPVSRALKLS